MTSQKSLKNNVNANDFKRSLVGSLLFPAIAFIVLFVTLTMPVIKYVTSEDYLMAIEHNEISLFVADSSAFNYAFELVPMGMIACGMLTAVKSFSYLLSKKQVNVYLSLGIKRNTMFVNRLLSGVISLFIAVFVPMLVIYITNIICFGLSAHLTSLFFYIVSLLFVSGLFGYAVASTMIMASGNVLETAVSTVAATFIPYFAYATGIEWLLNFLKGFTTTADYDKWLCLFNPWQIANNYGNDSLGNPDMYMYGGYSNIDGVRPIHILRLFERTTTPDKFKVPEIYKVDFGFMLPIILWFAVALVLVGTTFYLFNRRKAEHANSLGKFAVTRAVVGTTAFIALTYFVVSGWGYDMNAISIFLMVLLATFISYFVIQLLLSRKFKTAFKSLSWYGVLVGIVAVFAIIIGTGFFGTYNKIPEKEEVKSVSISIETLENYAHYINPRDEFANYVKATSDGSKDAVLEIFELLKNEKVPNKRNEGIIGTVRLAVTDNEGKVKHRLFDIYSEETYLKYVQAIYGSDFFDAVLKNYLIDEISTNTNDDTGHLKTFQWAVTDTDRLEVVGSELNYIDDVDALCKALYDDLSVMSVDKLLKNNEKPIALLVKSTVDTDYPGATHMRTEDKYFPITESGYIDDSEYTDYKYYQLSYYLPVYEEMTNTVKFLKDIGYEFKNETYEIKEILYTDSPLSYNGATSEWLLSKKDNFSAWGNYTYYISNEYAVTFESKIRRLYDQWTIGYFIDEDIKEYDLLKESYKTAGHPLTSVTDKAEIEKIMDKTVIGDYLTIGDSGRYVYVIYEEGMIMTYYLPEANTSVVK